jgi:Flp pilus assembly CpaF family ATPase
MQRCSARDEIADIMVNGSGTVYIEFGSKIQKTGIRFATISSLLNIAACDRRACAHHPQIP